MAGNFPIGQLGDVASVRSGYAFRSKDMGDYGLPIIKIKNIVPPTVDVSAVQRILESIVEGDNRIAQFALSAGDILIAMTGATVGKVGRMPETLETYYLNQRVGKVFLESPEKADYDFLYQVLSQDTHTRMMFGIADGSAQANISGGQIEGLEIPLPLLPEQKAIAHILGTLDDKIGLNRRMNETLEQIARAIFKSWFIDFEFPNEKGKPYKSSGGEMIDSELGKIPKGWKVACLEDMTAFVIGGDWGKEVQNEDATEAAYCIRGADIPDLQKSSLGNTPVRYLTKTSLQNRSLCNGDIVFEISGGSPTQQTGRVVFITNEFFSKLEHPLVCTNFCRLLRLKKGIYSPFIYLWLRHLYSIETFWQYESGTTGIKNFSFMVFCKEHKFVLSPEPVLDRFATLVSPFFKQRDLNGYQSRILVSLRDTLLPKLLSGEIRVKDAERFLKERGL